MASKQIPQQLGKAVAQPRPRGYCSRAKVAAKVRKSSQGLSVPSFDRALALVNKEWMKGGMHHSFEQIKCMHAYAHKAKKDGVLFKTILSDAAKETIKQQIEEGRYVESDAHGPPYMPPSMDAAKYSKVRAYLSVPIGRLMYISGAAFATTLGRQ